MKILLAEDDIDLGNVLSQYLKLSGFEVDLAVDGNETLKKFISVKPDICVLDVLMPGLDGFSVARQIRKSSQEIPFIFLTAKNQ
jgi:DNA-binding response OmpR family regulator